MIPGDVRAELVAHSEAEAPNEACGLLVLRDGVAERYVRGRNAAASPEEIRTVGDAILTTGPDARSTVARLTITSAVVLFARFMAVEFAAGRS